MASTFDTVTIGDTPGNEDELDTSAELTTERAKPQSSHWGHAPNSADPVRDHLSHLQHDMQASDMPPRVPWDSTIAEAAHRLRVTQVIAEIRPELIADEFNEEHFAREWPIYAPTSFGLNYLLDTYGLSEAHITDTRGVRVYACIQPRYRIDRSGSRHHRWRFTNGSSTWYTSALCSSPRYHLLC